MMKIVNNLSTTSIISKIKYPFIKIASLFHRATTAHRIQIMENPKYLTPADIPGYSKSISLSRTESVASNIIEDEEISDYQHQYEYKSPTLKPKNSEVRNAQEMTTFNHKDSQEANRTHLYTRINKTGNGKIERYFPYEISLTCNPNAQASKGKNKQPHPFLQEIKEVKLDPPLVPPKDKALYREILQRDALFLRFPRNSKEMRLTILKGSELFI